MTSTTKPLPEIVNFPDDAPVFTPLPKEKRALAAINTAMKAHRKTSHPATSSEACARANDRVDRAYQLPITRFDEAEAMLRLVLASDSEVIDEAILRALESIARVLTATVKATNRQ